MNGQCVGPRHKQSCGGTQSTCTPNECHKTKVGRLVALTSSSLLPATCANRKPVAASASFFVCAADSSKRETVWISQSTLKQKPVSDVLLHRFVAFSASHSCNKCRACITYAGMARPVSQHFHVRRAKSRLRNSGKLVRPCLNWPCSQKMEAFKKKRALSDFVICWLGLPIKNKLSWFRNWIHHSSQVRDFRPALLRDLHQ